MYHFTEVCVEFYKRGMYEKIPIGMYPDNTLYYMTQKQINALKLLNDNVTTHIGYGGSARSGKTVIECIAIIFDCLAYYGIAWGLGRLELVRIKKTVIKTLYELFSFYGLKKDIDYKHDQQLNIITFKNGSEVFLIETKYYPTDPLFLRFGGYELTKCAIDESNESSNDAVKMLFSRCGWRKNIDHNIKKKMFETFNPDKSHVYTRYYKPFRDNLETETKKFIPALPGDNPHPAVKEWIEDIISQGDLVLIERLVNGNFDYDDDPSILVSYDAICDIFTRKIDEKGDKHISADLAMKGRDRFVAGRWINNTCFIEIDKQKCDSKEIEMDLTNLKDLHNIGNSQIIADSDGLGAYLSGYIKNIVEFHGGSSPENKELYGNLKDECAFKLAELINNRELTIVCNFDQQERIKQELSVCLRSDNVNNDKKRIIKKEKQKLLLGHSPDYFDMLNMGMLKKIKCSKSFGYDYA